MDACFRSGALPLFVHTCFRARDEKLLQDRKDMLRGSEMLCQERLLPAV
jgi:hypothetical protein